MSHATLSAANKAAVLMLRAAFVLTATLGTMFLLTRAGDTLPHGRTLLLATALTGSITLAALLIRLFRESALSLATNTSRDHTLRQ